MDFIDCVSSALHAQAYYNAFKQLYSSLPSDWKSALQPYKTVFYVEASIPEFLASNVSGAGNFSFNCDEVWICEPTTLFLQWLHHGLVLDPSFHIAADQRFDKFVWKTKFCKEYVNERVPREFRRIACLDSKLLVLSTDKTSF